SVNAAVNGINTPPVVFPDWGPEVSTFLSFRAGMHNLGPVTVGPVDDDIGTPGYGNVNGRAVTSPAKSGAAVAAQWAVRDACVEVEEPGPWASGSDVFGGFLYSETVTIAARGFCGDPPQVQGGQEVEVNDVVSQRVFDAILPHANPAELFATVEDAEDYCRAVLVRHATERPLLSLTFVATSGAAYRAQAIRRRVGDRVRVDSTHTPGGLGVARDFYIEHVPHSSGAAGKRWGLTWQLAPWCPDRAALVRLRPWPCSSCRAPRSAARRAPPPRRASSTSPARPPSGSPTTATPWATSCGSSTPLSRRSGTAVTCSS